MLLVERARDRELEHAVTEELEPLVGQRPVRRPGGVREDVVGALRRELVDQDRSSRGSPHALRLLVCRDVVDCLPDGLDLLRVLVGDLDPELILELHDQLDQVERIGVEVFLEGRLPR